MEQRSTVVCPHCHKVAFRSWREARDAARRLRWQRHVRVWAYHSRRCDCFHVGSSLTRAQVAAA